MKLFIALIIIFNTFACTSTPLTPGEEYVREDALIVEREKFWRAYDYCSLHGVVVFSSRRMTIRRPSAKPEDRHKIDKWTMRSARCAPRP